MRAGKLRHPLTLQANSGTTPDAATGQMVETWTTLRKVWGSIETAESASREIWNGYRMKGSVTHVVRIRYVEGIDTTSRVLYRDRIFNLAGPPINRLERDRELMLPVNEVVAG